jgi:sec-independent protein translocase protein TatA
MPGGWELVLILLVVVVVFGAKRLPDTARSVGRSMRILKAETQGLRTDEERPVVAPQLSDAPQLFDAQGRPVRLPEPGSSASAVA